MRVRCLRIVNPATLGADGLHHSVEVGGEYVVLEIFASPGRPAEVRLNLSPGLPSLWSAEMFETIDARIPSNWVVTVEDGGLLSLGPASWRGDFWERYFDDDPEARATFEAERAIIVGNA